MLPQYPYTGVVGGMPTLLPQYPKSRRWLMGDRPFGPYRKIHGWTVSDPWASTLKSMREPCAIHERPIMDEPLTTHGILIVLQTHGSPMGQSIYQKLCMDDPWATHGPVWATHGQIRGIVL